MTHLRINLKRISVNLGRGSIASPTTTNMGLHLEDEQSLGGWLIWIWLCTTKLISNNTDLVSIRHGSVCLTDYDIIKSWRRLCSVKTETPNVWWWWNMKIKMMIKITVNVNYMGIGKLILKPSREICQSFVFFPTINKDTILQQINYKQLNK